MTSQTTSVFSWRKTRHDIRGVCRSTLILVALAFEVTTTGRSLAQVPNLDEAPAFELVGTDPLPEVSVAGRAAKIHTQGLWVSSQHYWVTGRLEKEPKRAVMVRFSRKVDGEYEVRDISIPDHPELDHPGGFDVDTDGDAWVPVSSSNARGPTMIYRWKLAEDRPLADQVPEVVLKLDDHIGAVAYDPQQETWWGANWDTGEIYQWHRDGRLQQKFSRVSWLPNEAHRHLAIQDWKHVSLQGRLVLLAGGIDKSPGRDPNQSPAEVQWVDTQSRQVVQRVRIDPLPSVQRPATNEGLAWSDGELYLLPEDLGAGAAILRFRQK